MKLFRRLFISQSRAQHISTRTKKPERDEAQVELVGHPEVPIAFGEGRPYKWYSLAPCRPVLRVRCSLVFSLLAFILVSFSFFFYGFFAPGSYVFLSKTHGKSTEISLASILISTTKFRSRWAPTCSSGFAGPSSCAPRKWPSKSHGLPSADVLGW